MVDLPDPRRTFFGVAKRLLFQPAPDVAVPDTGDDVPRLTPRNLDRARMPRSRDRILGNLEEMYKEAFDRARASEDPAQMTALDFAYRREQLYFEILLDIRDAMERRA